MVVKMVPVDGAALFAEAIALDRPRVALLLAGAAMQATCWEDPFVDALVASNVGVVRFDWRDIGESTWRSFKDHPYSIDDLANDVVAVGTAFGLDRFDLVGFSMGGCVAQLVTVARPDCVRSLTLLSSGLASVIDADAGERGARLWEVLRQPRPTSDDEMVTRLIDQWRVLCGEDFTFDDEAWQARAQGWVARGQNPSCPHIRLGPEVFSVDRCHELAAIRVPTQVMHGTDDPMFPHAHGEHIAATIPGADLELLDGRGHDLHLDAAVSHRVARHILDV